MFAPVRRLSPANLLRDRAGVTAVEYGGLGLLLGLVIVEAVHQLGGRLFAELLDLL